MVTEVLREQPRITVAHARVLGNSLLRPERLTARLVADATDTARNLRERKAHRDRTTLQDVILGEGLTSVYQPIVDLGTGDIFAFEALTRGPRTTPFESPATLFAIADEVDLTVELDRACFRGALRNAMTLEPVHRLFVNLLPMSFYDSAFIEVEVGNLLSAAGLTPANIVFEITERLAIENFASFKRALAQYTAMGFGVAIDDVGTRHSNLETVMSLRPHFIKISDVLVRGIARSTVKREMLRSLRHIAETIDAVMIAEGIEQVEDVVALRELGLRYGQGYYMARPGPPFPSLPDYVRAELRSTSSSNPQPVPAKISSTTEDDDEDDDRDLSIPQIVPSKSAVPRNVFGRPEDEITSDFAIPGLERPTRQIPRASEPPDKTPASSAPNVPVPWQPLSDDEATGEALLSALKRAEENAPEGEPGPGGPGLN
jgi:EAL domain-containing protein (putative c-di-GMP-specific phosphodiesterase class I)